MATTIQTNSLISTSTLASASSSTPTNGSSDGEDTITGLFSSSGSPPLIMTFLAIGLFVVLMTGIFGWRRLSRSRSRGLDTQPVIRLIHRRKSISLGKRPMLWDIWADLKIREKSPRWENSTPMTAILTFLTPPVQPLVEPLAPIKSVDPDSHILFRMLRCLVSAVKRFYFPDPPPPPPPPLPTEPEVIPILDEIEWGDASSLQASVIIAMPTERWCGNGTSEDPERMELGEFCIGTMNVPWSEGG